MVNGINKYEGKDRREQRRRNHIAHDLRSPKCAPRVVKERKKSYLGDNENDGFFFEDRYYDDQTTDD